MPTVTPAGIDALMDKDRRCIEFHCSAQFTLGHDANSVGRRFFVSYDSARYMPTWAIKLVAPPGEQRPPVIVAYQQINVNEGRDPAYKEKHLLRQSVRPLVDLTLKVVDQRHETVRPISQS